MPREALQREILEKINTIQEGKDKIVWISGTQMTQLFPKKNPSSIRMALSLLAESGQIRRERRKGRGPKGKTGQSAWYSALNVDPYEAVNGPKKIPRRPAKKKNPQKTTKKAS